MTVKELASLLGVTRQSVYNNLGNKKKKEMIDFMLTFHPLDVYLKISPKKREWKNLYKFYTSFSEKERKERMKKMKEFEKFLKKERK